MSQPEKEPVCINDAIKHHELKVQAFEKALKESKERIVELKNIDQTIISSVSEYERYKKAREDYTIYTRMINDKVQGYIDYIKDDWNEYFACIDWNRYFLGAPNMSRSFDWNDVRYFEDDLDELVQTLRRDALANYNTNDTKKAWLYFKTSIDIIHRAFNAAQLKENINHGFCPKCRQYQINSYWCRDCGKIASDDFDVTVIKMNQKVPTFM